MTEWQFGSTARGSSVSMVVTDRIVDTRKRRGWSAAQLAAKLRDAGDEKMTANILMNIEAGRRQIAITVDELFRLAFALDVPPEYLLAAREGQSIEIVPGVLASVESFMRWMRGSEPLPPTDSSHFARAADELQGLARMGESGRDDLRAEFLERASDMLGAFLADSEQMTKKTRGQVVTMLDDLRQALDAGELEVVKAKIDGYRQDLIRAGVG